MKIKLHLLGLLGLILLFSCNSEQLEDVSVEQNYFKVSEFTVDNNTTSRVAQVESSCYTVDLIAGQHMNIGSVAVSKTDTDLILTYTTIPGWTIGVTHVSIGDCNEEWAPTTGSGNPKIGKFGHTEPHSADINKVVYQISLETLPSYTDMYCFAAHAEVEGPEGEETAWAGGDNTDDDDDNGDGGGGTPSRIANAQNPYTVMEFPGRSWATYIQALQSACD